MGRTFKAIKRTLRKLRFRANGGTRFTQAFYSKPLMSALESCSRESDISDHLSALFYHALEASPRLIVELGTRGGESTRILLAVAEITGGRMLSLDVDDCSGIKVPHADRWEFIRGDDVAFGRDRFVPWCAARGLAPKADVIFIDTSHLYEHTKEELKAWTGHLTDTGTLILHDTNMGDGVYGRHDGSVGLGWNNQRGVIRAVEEFLGRQYNEDKVFSDTAAGFLVKHYPNCNGLTVLKRLPVLG